MGNIPPYVKFMPGVNPPPPLYETLSRYTVNTKNVTIWQKKMQKYNMGIQERMI
jgi:hypothetical protein